MNYPPVLHRWEILLNRNWENHLSMGYFLLTCLITRRYCRWPADANVSPIYGWMATFMAIQMSSGHPLVPQFMAILANSVRVRLTCAKRREFSGMIHWLTMNFIIPATPSNPTYCTHQYFGRPHFQGPFQWDVLWRSTRHHLYSPVTNSG